MQKRSEKEQVIKELHEKLERAQIAIVAQPNKLDVGTVTQLRKSFRKQQVEYKVVKNTLAKKAAKGTAAEVLSDLLEGPTALIVGYADPIAPAKVLQEFIAKKAEAMTVRGAMLDGKLIDAKAIERLAKLPGLDELHSMIAGIINRPAQMLATVIAQPATSLSRVIDARRAEEAKKAA